MSLVRWQIQHHWFQLCTDLRLCESSINTLGFIYELSPSTCRSSDMLDRNIFRFGYALNLSACGSEKASDLISLDLATCWVHVHVSLIWCQTQTSLDYATCLTQVLVGLERWQTQHPYVQLCAKPNCLWV